jgi:hypothetical protein
LKALGRLPGPTQECIVALLSSLPDNDAEDAKTDEEVAASAEAAEAAGPVKEAEEKVVYTNRVGKGRRTAVNISLSIQKMKESVAKLKDDTRMYLETQAAKVAGWSDDGHRVVSSLVSSLCCHHVRTAATVSLQSLLHRVDPALVKVVMPRVPRTRVGVVKSLVALATLLPNDEGLEAVLEVGGSAGVCRHQHVQCAVGRALYRYLHDVRAREALEKMVVSPSVHVAMVAARVPVGRLMGEAQEWAVSLIARCLDVVVAGVSRVRLRQAALEHLEKSEELAVGLPRGLQDVLLALLLCATVPPESKTTVCHILVLQLKQASPEALVRIVGSLLAPDLLQVLQQVVILVCAAVRQDQQANRRCALMVQQALQPSRVTLGLQVDLLHACARSGTEDLPLMLLGFAQKLIADEAASAATEESVLLHPDLMHKLQGLLETWPMPWDKKSYDAIVPVLKTLAASPDGRLRRLGLALLSPVAARTGWTQEFFDLLLGFRRDDNLYIQQAAVFVPAELYVGSKELRFVARKGGLKHTPWDYFQAVDVGEDDFSDASNPFDFFGGFELAWDATDVPTAGSGGRF